MKRLGFTLVELLLVVLILGILAAIVVPRVTQGANDANKSKCASNIANLIRALEMDAIRNGGTYPANQAAFNTRVLNNVAYWPHGLPVCPFAQPYVYNAGTMTITAHNHP